MTDSKQTTVTEVPAKVSADGRRRFLGAGVGATPALMMLASQPALGVTCFSPSRALSRNTSVSQQGKYGDCTGISPGNYKTQTTPGAPSYHWPAAPVPTTLFHSIFSGSYFEVTKSTTGGGTRSLTLLEVLDLPTVPPDVMAVPSDPSKLAFHIIGAYLNVQKGFIPATVLDSQKVKNIWSELALRGYFEPTAGVKWYPADVVTYLQNSGIAP